ncbi:ABC transporter substrate-binding protein [Halobellus captivus]|uniref:ABC transporter substrate-binding protein n=1 Tax=Halobellus captivus TaxID=2592614 RepID=UPI0011A892A1|nr:ABC transporter substrate-binding protein [Halobellus captivus]
MADRRRDTIPRRKVLGSIGALAMAGLAGCGGNSSGDGSGDGGSGDGGGGQNLGERVPEPVTVEYYANIAWTSYQESMAPVITENLEELLGVSVDVRPVAAGTMIENVIEDQRNSHFSFFSSGMNPMRLDPHQMTRRWAIDWAGGDGQSNLANYANCEYSELAMAQGSATSPDERRDLVNQAHSVMSEDVGLIPVLPDILRGAYNSERVDIGGLGTTGIHDTAPYPLIKSTPTQGDRIAVNGNPSLLRLKNYYKQSAGPALARLNTYLHSPLAEFDENFELTPVLADDWQVSEDSQQIDVQLRETTFSNGDPVTANDVKYTFEHIWSNVGVYPYAEPPEEYTIEVNDERSLTFQFGSPRPAFVPTKFPRWGIVSESAWTEAGAEEDPETFTPPFVNSGPFEVTEWTQGEFLSMDPREDEHPVHNPSHGVDYVSYTEESAVMEAFLAGELEIVSSISAGAAQRVEEEFDAGETVINSSMWPHYLAPQHPIAPVKFREFRAAVGQSLDRSLMNELAANGGAEPEQTLHSVVFLPSHPSRPPEDMLYQMTDDVTGDIEGARQRLEDAGWGWDNDGVLRYPADADTSPLWPAGEEPTSENFSCINGDGEMTFE